MDDRGPPPSGSVSSADAAIHVLGLPPARAAAGRRGRPRAPGDDRMLFRRYRATGNRADRDAIFDRFVLLARHVALRHSGGQEPFDDLYQVACLALVKAIERYDPERPAAFSSFAVPTISGELKRHFRDRTWTVRVPRGLQELAIRMQRVEERMAGELGRPPTVFELADATSLAEADVRDALQARGARTPTSLDGRRAADDSDREILGERLAGSDRGYRQVEHRVHLDALIGCLSDRQRTALLLYFEDDLTQREIGERMGVSPAAVYRLLREALDLLRAEDRRSQAGVAAGMR